MTDDERLLLTKQKVTPSHKSWRGPNTFLVPSFSKVGGDASHGSSGAVAPVVDTTSTPRKFSSCVKFHPVDEVLFGLSEGWLLCATSVYTTLTSFSSTLARPHCARH